MNGLLTVLLPRLLSPNPAAPGVPATCSRAVDYGGRLAARIGVPETGHRLSGDRLTREVSRLASGTYLVVLQCDGEQLVLKPVLN